MKSSSKANSKLPMWSITILAALVWIIRPNPTRPSLFCKQELETGDCVCFHGKLQRPLVGSIAHVLPLLTKFSVLLRFPPVSNYKSPNQGFQFFSHPPDLASLKTKTAVLPEPCKLKLEDLT